MALSIPNINDRLEQTPQRGSPGTPRLDGPQKRSSLNSDRPHGRQYSQRDPAMFRPTLPTNSNGHVLQRQPRLSFLGRQQQVAAEKAASVWNTKESQRSPSLSKDTRTQSSRSALPAPRRMKPPPIASQYPPEERGPDPYLYAAVLKDRKDLERTLGHMKNWDAVIDFLDDVSSSEGLGVARHSTAPHAITPHRGEYLGHLKTTYARHSSEWETETLLDQSSGSPDVDMAAYPCPFRKRNPSRFNIRDHESCARTPFDSVFGLKHHIITHHRRKPARHQCRRCKQQFDTEIDLEEHLLLPKDQMCEVNTSLATNPEDGITEGMARMLAARDSMEETWTWEGIWRLVFPGDPEAPDSDFQPVAELVEVEQAFDEGHEALKESLREKLQLLLPPDLDGTYLGFLTGQLELVFETHRVNIMKQSLSRCCSTTSQEQPSTAINNTQITTEQQGGCPPRKQPNRRSRRNTLLQQPFQRNKTQDDSTTRRHSSRPSSSTRHTSYYRQSTDRPLLPHNPRSTHPVSSEEDEQHDTAATNNTSTNSNSNSSSSRDSGIGMPCDTCDSSLAADGGGCRCTDTSKPNKADDDADDDGGGDDDDEDNTGGGGGGGGGQHHAATAAAPHNHAHDAHAHGQPRLSLRTGDLDSIDHNEDGGSAVAGGRFSPESFMQRVLRKQLVAGGGGSGSRG